MAYARTSTKEIPGKPEGADADVPLVVDLEGALLRGDLMIESLVTLVKQRPSRLLAALSWLARGRAYFERRLVQEIAPDVSTLPYDYALLVYLESERARGRTIVLVSEAGERVAKGIADRFGFFAGILIIDGERKRDKLVSEFKFRGFDYVGRRPRDWAVWAAARKAVLADPANGLQRQIEKITEVERVLTSPPAGVNGYLAALRPQQWLKNLLVFVPLAVADRAFEPIFILQAALALVAFSLCASSGYLINDLLDIPRDRTHPRKKERPLASGRMSAIHAIVLIPLLLLGGVGVALLLPSAFLIGLGAYYALSLAYSLRLKEIVILDVITLAVLYTLRVAGGAWAVGMPQSSWVLGFCVFLFFSLALIKRYAELMMMHGIEGRLAHARAYVLQDRELLASLGGASGYLAVLVLGLWITIQNPLPNPYQILWLDCLLLFYWITRMWLVAHRGRMEDDPLVFALRDRVSRLLILVMMALLIGARLS